MPENVRPTATWLDLYDYRRRVAAMYRDRDSALRAGEDALSVLLRFRAQKDALFAYHPQSALSQEKRRGFTGLRYFPYNPALRVEALMEPETADAASDLPASGAHAITFRRAAWLRFEVEGKPLQLAVYWIDVYGGGLFLPFHDATCPGESYGGGRYLFDTVKGSDLMRLGDAPDSALNLPTGYDGGRIILDFNYAYNPSCAYDERWVCPLSPHENRLEVGVRAGEMKFNA